jgi:diacylglycerol kinase family enzyme
MILVNPKAREGRVGEKWPDLEAQLLGALGDGQAQIAFTSATDYGSGMVRKALREGAWRILVVGGDGTISEAIQGFFEGGELVSRDAVLAVMPAGRGDDFFKVLAGGRCKSSADAWRQGLELLRSGKPGPTDLGRVAWIGANGEAPRAGTHDRAFINLASFGYPGLVVKRVNEHAGALGRTRMGKSGWAYLVQIATGLVQYKPIPTEVKVDGKVVFDGPLFSGFVLNGYYNAGGMRWSHEARIDDGILHVVLSEPRNPVSTALTGPRMLSGDWRGVKGIHIFEGRRVEIRARDERPRDFPFFEIDGEQPEKPGTVGAVIEVLPAAIRVWK